MRVCPRCGKQLAGSVSRHLRDVHEETEEAISAFVKASISSGGSPETDTQGKREGEREQLKVAKKATATTLTTR